MISERSLHKQKSKSDYLDRGKITRTTGTGMYQVGASKELAGIEHHACSVPQIMRMLGTSDQRTCRRQAAASTLLVLVPTAQSIVQQLLRQDYVSCERVQRP